MTNLLQQLAAFFHVDFHIEFADSADIIGDIFENFNKGEKQALRSELIELIAHEDAEMDAAFRRLGFEIAAKSPADLRAFLTYLVDRIDNRDVPVMELK